jgi:7-carboxy-7-deazaguanine synthase
MAFQEPNISSIIIGENEQLKSKEDLYQNGQFLPLMEEFYTIQGEGFNTGKAAYFIRLGGCDIGCHWCDVKDSWNPGIHPITSIHSIVQNAIKFPAKSIVITGGEPLLYKLDSICFEFKKNGLQTFLETSGAYPLSGIWDWICVSPKKFKPPIKEALEKADELKVIVFNESDFIWAEKYSFEVSKSCKLYLQPEWSKSEFITPKIVDYVMQNPKWEISLQTHKYLHIP